MKEFKITENIRSIGKTSVKRGRVAKHLTVSVTQDTHEVLTNLQDILGLTSKHGVICYLLCKYEQDFKTNQSKKE